MVRSSLVPRGTKQRNVTNRQDDRPDVCVVSRLMLKIHPVLLLRDAIEREEAEKYEGEDWSIAKDYVHSRLSWLA